MAPLQRLLLAAAEQTILAGESRRWLRRWRQTRAATRSKLRQVAPAGRIRKAARVPLASGATVSSKDQVRRDE